jgi:dTDP-4-dehydrorhamnose reductase
MKTGLLILGGSGYLGTAFQSEMRATGMAFHAVRRSELDYTQFGKLRQLISDANPTLVINCAAYLAGGSVSNCDNHKGETLRANAIFPATLANACESASVPLMHLSTACLYNELREYDETDPPIRGFDGYCGTYVGSKLLAENFVGQYPDSYILRIRLPFDEFNSPRNYLTKLAGFTSVWNHLNSLTHRRDMVRHALELWKNRAPYGIYNCCCVGQITAREVVTMMASAGIIETIPKVETNYTSTGSRMSVQKLVNAGVKVRHVTDAVDEAISYWRP